MASKNLVQGEKGLLCVKCSHLNPGNLTACEYCEAPLFIICKKCEAKVQRALSQCQKCGHRLHKSFLSKLESKMFARSRKITLGQFGLLIILALFMYQVIKVISEKL